MISHRSNMNSLRMFLFRFCNLFRKSRLEREMESELSAHVELHMQENLRAGTSPEEARRQALLKSGGMEQTKESVRDLRDLDCMDSVLRDVRHGSVRARADWRERGVFSSSKEETS